jgi:hypothetical protein
MKIAFHGSNAANFRPGFADLLDGDHEIVDLGDALEHPGEREHFASAEVIVGIRLGATEPYPAKLRLYHAPAAGIDAIDTSRLPAGALLCNCFGHEHAIAEYVFAALLQRHVPIADADRRLRDGQWRTGPARQEHAHRARQPDDRVAWSATRWAVAARAKGIRAGRQANRLPVAADALIDASYGFDQLQLPGRRHGSSSLPPLKAPPGSSARRFAACGRKPSSPMSAAGR